MSLPDKKYFEYISHLYHNNLIPLEHWVCSNMDYPDTELQKFTNLLENNQQYVKDKKILDLGCHSGYIAYIAKHLGASSVIGLNARAEPIDVANYFFKQLNQSNYKFINGNIEDFRLLENLCDQSDTVIISSVLEHLRNPEYVIRTITNSKVKNILIESTIVEDSISDPRLYYYIQDSKFDFNAFDGNPKSLGSCPNQRFLETVLYYHGWKITNYIKYDSFSKDWFGIENLDTMPTLRKVIVIAATKFKQ